MHPADIITCKTFATTSLELKSKHLRFSQKKHFFSKLTDFQSPTATVLNTYLYFSIFLRSSFLFHGMIEGDFLWSLFDNKCSRIFSRFLIFFCFIFNFFHWIVYYVKYLLTTLQRHPFLLFKTEMKGISISPSKCSKHENNYS